MSENKDFFVSLHSKRTSMNKKYISLSLALVMSVTMSGQNKNAPVNEDESKVQKYEPQTRASEAFQPAGIWRDATTNRH